MIATCGATSLSYGIPAVAGVIWQIRFCMTGCAWPAHLASGRAGDVPRHSLIRVGQGGPRHHHGNGAFQRYDAHSSGHDFGVDAHPVHKGLAMICSNGEFGNGFFMALASLTLCY